ncbi:MAG: hypothetical protein KF873_17965 [Gemmataceae bacterium]|nr:hypothetical protein [Gemmataceae bacterium]
MAESLTYQGSSVRPLTLFATVITGILLSGALGGVTNAVNGWVSPEYFVSVMQWYWIENVWRASVAQGIFEGLLFGVLFSLIFTTCIGIITRASCRYRFAVRHILIILAGALVGWILGGLAATGLASLSPDFYRKTFSGVPEETGPMLCFAWVGGSIWGIELGGLVSVVLGLVIFRSNWLRQTAQVQ